MGLKLNRASEAALGEDLVFRRKLAEKCQELLRNTNESDCMRILQLTRNIGHELLAVGLTSYQQQRSFDEVRAALQNATLYLTKAFQLSEKCGSYETKRDEWQFMSFDTLLNLLPVFGSPELLRVVAQLPRSAFDFVYTFDGTSLSDHPGAILFMDLFRHFIHDNVWDEQAFVECERFCAAPNASRMEHHDFYLRLRTLKAACNQRQLEWNECLTEIVDRHKMESLRGKYRLLYDAYICLPGLSLAQLGRRYGMTCTVSSAYLPIRLLE